LDAGQVGVSVVRRVGSRVSMRLLRAGRCGIRERQFVVPALRTVPARQWTDSGLRMGIFGLESSGTRVGLLARVPDRSRSRISRKMLPQAADQLRVVGQQSR